LNELIEIIFFVSFAVSCLSLSQLKPSSLINVETAVTALVIRLVERIVRKARYYDFIVEGSEWFFVSYLIHSLHYLNIVFPLTFFALPRYFTSAQEAWDHLRSTIPHPCTIDSGRRILTFQQAFVLSDQVKYHALLDFFVHIALTNSWIVIDDCERLRARFLSHPRALEKIVNHFVMAQHKHEHSHHYYFPDLPRQRVDKFEPFRKWLSGELIINRGFGLPE
jgi:hypothetical protein